MNNNSKSKLLLVLGLALIIGGLYYFFNLKSSPNTSALTPTATPYQVIVPKDNKDATIYLYKTAPDGFPTEVILEGKALSYSESSRSPSGVTQMGVAYQSDKSVADVLALYKETLPTNGWTVHVNSTTNSVATMTASKGNESVLITIAATTKVPGSLVTFQYHK